MTHINDVEDLANIRLERMRDLTKELTLELGALIKNPVAVSKIIKDPLMPFSASHHEDMEILAQESLLRLTEWLFAIRKELITMGFPYEKEE